MTEPEFSDYQDLSGDEEEEKFSDFREDSRVRTRRMSNLEWSVFISTKSLDPVFNSLLELYHRTFPEKCRIENCDGKCDRSIFAYGGLTKVCSQRNIFRLNPHDFYRYWDASLNPNIKNPLLIPIASRYSIRLRCPVNCEKGHHIYQTMMYAFTNGARCPFCTRHRTCPCESAKEKIPEIEFWFDPKNVDEYGNPCDLSKISYKSNRRFTFRCPSVLNKEIRTKSQHFVEHGISCKNPAEHHVWRAKMMNFNASHCCPYCSNIRACPCNSLVEKCPDLPEHVYFPQRSRLFIPDEIIDVDAEDDPVTEEKSEKAVKVKKLKHFTVSSVTYLTFYCNHPLHYCQPIRETTILEENPESEIISISEDPGPTSETTKLLYLFKMKICTFVKRYRKDSEMNFYCKLCYETEKKREIERKKEDQKVKLPPLTTIGKKKLSLYEKHLLLIEKKRKAEEKRKLLSL